MEMMNELLEKYFRGETSLHEEKELKKYFSGGNVASGHEIYRALFEEFDLELKDKAQVPFKKVLQRQQKPKRIWFQTFAYTGIAATLFLLLWIQLPNATESFAVIHGNRIDNTEFANRYAGKRFTKVTEMLAKSMKPMESFNKVRKGIDPLQNVSDVRNKMDELKDKLQFNK